MGSYLDLPIDEIIKLYTQDGLSRREIGQLFGCSDVTIGKKLKKNGVLIRSNSEAHKGRKHPLYGKHHLKKTKQKIREARLKRKSQLGYLNSPETREKIRKALKGKPLPQQVKDKVSKTLTGRYLGRESSQWKGGITSLRFAIYNLSEYTEWRAEVLRAGDYKCFECGRIGGKLEAHHKKAFAQILAENKIKSVIEAQMCKELWDVENGVVLCRECHLLTSNYGGKSHQKNNRQILQFLTN